MRSHWRAPTLLLPTSFMASRTSGNLSSHNTGASCSKLSYSAIISLILVLIRCVGISYTTSRSRNSDIPVLKERVQVHNGNITSNSAIDEDDNENVARGTESENGDVAGSVPAHPPYSKLP